MVRIWGIGALAAASVWVGGMATAQQDDLYLPNLVYRAGPFAAAGTPLANGQRDYIALLNARDGGVGGVRLDYDECATEYDLNAGTACFEALADGAAAVVPGATGLAVALMPQAQSASVPLLTPGYGFSPVAYGGVFPYAFNPPASYWDGAHMILQDIAGGEDLAALEGQTIAYLHLENAFGQEPLALLEAMAEEHGFTLTPVSVPTGAMEDLSGQWADIQSAEADAVILWSWGPMTAAALTGAVEAGYPMGQIRGVWWAGHDGDLAAMGADASGYRVISWSAAIADAPVLSDLREYVIDPGDSLIGTGQPTWLLYQRGLLTSMILTEAIRAAQGEYDTDRPDAEQVRWGLENLDIDEARLEELGMTGMMPAFATACDDHTGHSGGWILQWDGTRFAKDGDLMQADREALAPLEEERALAYAEAQDDWQMNEGCAP